MAMPVAIQSIEPTRLDIHHNVNKVILLKVVNPDTSPNILNNVNNLNGSCSSHARFTSCQSPGFSMVERKTDSEPILKAAAPQQPGFTLHHNAPETSNIPTQAPRFRNSLKTKPTYSPIFLKELQQKY